jgi:inosine-uridine nucleoside N-ribohydrolase
VPVLIDTDAGCECDDQYAIALALSVPERFEVKGFVATFFRGSPESIPEAVAEIKLVQELCACAGAQPVVPGGAPLSYSGVGNGSDGAEFIIETARGHDAENPLWVVVLGPTTNTASALLACPEIADRIVVLFHGRTQYWPKQAWNNNVDADLRATQALFRSRAPLVLFDTGTYLRIENQVTRERLAVRGPVGAYLQDTREAKPVRQTLKKGFFDLGDVAWLADPALGSAERIEVPELRNDSSLDWKRTHGEALRVFQLEDRRVWELLFSALEKRYPRPTSYEPRPARVRLYPEIARERAEAERASAGEAPARRVPSPPGPDGRIPLLIDTDVGTEIDDQYAIAMVLACPDRFDLVGIAGCYFHDDPESPVECVRQAEHLLDLAGRAGACPVARGCDPLSWPGRPMGGEAVELIVEKVMERTPDDPLWIVALGPLSNVASAVLKRPEICERAVLVFHARSRHWDLKFSSYNALQDPRAARAVMCARGCRWCSSTPAPT